MVSTHEIPMQRQLNFFPKFKTSAKQVVVHKCGFDRAVLMKSMALHGLNYDQLNGS
jgi:hypothetical protein